LGARSGLFMAMGSGLCMGLQALPFKLSGSTDSWSYSIGESFGQCVVLVTASVAIQLLKGKLSVCCLGFRQGSLAGVAGGSFLFIAATLNTFAVREIGLVGSCIGQANLIVAGLWGIVAFHELVGRRLIMLWCVGAALTLLGAISVQIKRPDV